MELKYPRLQENSGQAAIEYVLVIFLSLMIFGFIMKWTVSSGLVEAITRPVKEQYKVLYKYGHPKAKGFDEGGPDYHPEPISSKNGRIFINPQ